MKSTIYTLHNFKNSIETIVKTPEIVLCGYRFDCEIEITGEKLLQFYFHPLIRAFEFDFIVNVKNSSNGSVADKFEEHILVELDLTSNFEFKSQTPIEDEWLTSDGSLVLEFQIIPSEADYSSQLDFIFEVLLGQYQGDDALDIYAIQWMLGVSERLFLTEPSLLKLNTPINIGGDLHGQFYDLIRIFKNAGKPDDHCYLFLGDYVDRGYNSLSLILLLLAYKIKYPNKFFLIRGNHEVEDISSKYGFKDEVATKYGSALFNDFIPLFNALPFGALIDGKIFCIHGGISPAIHSLDEINAIKRPFAPENGTGEFDLLWTDPSSQVEEYGPSPRGSSYIFGLKPLKKFMKDNQITFFIRAHEMVQDGYLYNFGEENNILTLFSASAYTKDMNKGGYLIIDKDGKRIINNYSPLTPDEKAEFESLNLEEYLNS